MGGVIIDPNIRKTAERIDANGNVINPQTKEIITPNETKEEKKARLLAELEALE